MLGHQSNLSNEEYHAAPGVSKTQLDKIHISGLAYWDSYLNPDREPREEENYFLIGDGTHKLILEPDLFKEQYAIGFDKSKYPDALDTVAELISECRKIGLGIYGTKSTHIEALLANGVKRSKIIECLKEDHMKINDGKKLIPASDYKHMVKSLEVLNKHHSASKLLKNALIEQSYFAADEDGLIRKCRPDFITANGQICCDLKTTNDVSQYGFGKTISKFRYHVQGAWYLDVLKMVLGNYAPKVFAFIALQKGRPYDVSVQFLTEEQIEFGRSIYQKDLSILKECLEFDIWPGSDNGQVLEAALPKWDMIKNNE